MSDHDDTAARRYLQSILQWHFSPETGSPFWLKRRDSLGFDPLRDVADFADLRNFPDVSDELRTVPVDLLVPAGSADSPFEVYESGGTLGAPKRVVEHTSRQEGVDWVETVLPAFGGEGHWLHVGPTGPHIVGRSVRRLAHLRSAKFFTVDFDPRWVKLLIRTERRPLAEEYVQHVLDQVEIIAESQDIRVLFITPPVLEALCARERLYHLLADRVTGIIWSGTSISGTSLRLLQTEFFPNAEVRGIYGNSLMGIAPQRSPEPGDTHPCVFRTFQPRSVVEVVDPDTGERVAPGERGRVLVHLLTKDLFLPNVLERDSAVRIPAGPAAYGDDLADVQPFRPTAGTQVIEGVY
ncbi:MULTISPECIES: phenazine biosynthesis protein [Streptomyces]|uniref:phenazine biosynthesis protein n=1 Tax=Streptomyces TaxID=1883 RepID=UPI001E3F0A38|nr:MULTISPECIES: phenazine biosynthesis protein [Streptomyces]UFQ19064.1 phenazine biosynthesis protein [Streptomyces huasconensis]WCL88683.1 phenazine biosynthesis protein [Streptomyces sp. JCM 35825]